jgi:ABC-2 type transport system permease protein
MGSIVTLAAKDLRLVCRDYFGLFWMLVFPLLFALFFGAIMGGSSRSSALPVAVVDEDRSDVSRAMVERLEKSEALQVAKLPRAEAREAVLKGRLTAYVVIPKGFGEAPMFGGGDGFALELGIDPSRHAEEGFLQGILMEAASGRMQDVMTDPKRSRLEIAQSLNAVEKAKDLPPQQRDALQHFLKEINQFVASVGPVGAAAGASWQPATIQRVAVTADRSGPRSAFEISFPSAVIWSILGCVTSFSISLVSERTGGTLLRLRVAPLTHGQVLAGKGLACFLACAGVAVLLLVLGRFVFGVRLESLVGLLLGIACTALGFTGIMMFLSTLGKTERGVAGAGWGVLMPLAMLGGGMIPLIAMPEWMRTASSLSPVKWAILALEGAIWRGYSLAEMLVPCGILLIVGAVSFAIGVYVLRRQET